MKNMRLSAPCLLLLLLLQHVTALAKDSTLIKFGAVWQYMDNGQPPAANWKTASLRWPMAPASFGYGNEVRTTVQYGSNAAAKYISTYFRHTLSITNPRSYDSFRINLYADDGAVIYINGKPCASSNMPVNPGHATPALAAAIDNGHAIQSYTVAAANFVRGKNMIAVELHQSDAASTDLLFDLELVGISGAAEPAIVRGPYLQMVSSDAVTVRWQTAAPSNGSSVYYGSTDAALTMAVKDPRPATDHELRITGLLPDTKYFYAIGSASSIVKGSYRNYFTTSPPASTKRSIRIGVFGDPGTGSAMQKGSRDAYLRLKNNPQNSELAIMLGDNAYNNGLESEHNTGFFNIYNNNIFDNHVLFPVPGNHEYANTAARAADHAIPYFSIFTVPDAGQSGGLPSGTEHYYSFDYGNIHFVMLDTYGIDGGKHLYDDTSDATGSQQAKWLKADLTANINKHKWTIVCMHHPPYTNGSHRSDSTNREGSLQAIRQRIVPILERFGVDVVLAGHSHVYERSFLVKDHTGLSTPFNSTAPGAGTLLNASNARYDGSQPPQNSSADTSAANSTCPYFTIDSSYKHGTVYVVAGSAGQIGSGNGNLYPVFYTRNQQISAGGETGALFLEIQDNRLDAKFVGNSGTVRDRFTIMKGVNIKKSINSTVNTPTQLSASWIGGYNRYSVPATVTGRERSLTIQPNATGLYTYYVNDSLAPANTCIADTFMVKVVSALSIAVSKYQATVKNGKIVLQWSTAAERNSDYFTVERSANGVDYETIMVLPAKGEAEDATHYEFTDATPLAGNAYYRLLATSKEGETNSVGIREVTAAANRPAAINVAQP
ncbi:MAG TPA: metallophosphoesterase family protein [Chitinophagaceae bacterium]|nr:metallophosphoesterase family protein [Chitinophagaceae bacterium]